MKYRRPETLVDESFEITMLGVFLTISLSLSNAGITGQNVAGTCMFLAITFVWKMLWPLKRLTQHFGWQVFSVIMIIICGWWLVYMAENTRAGWYRFNILETRVQSLVRGAPAYIILADENGIITECSDSIKLLTGYERSELIRQNLSILMRDGPAAKHMISYDKAIRTLRDNNSIDSGWAMQGSLTVGLKHKNNTIVPVRIYAGGIRWSTDIHFPGEIDVFAVIIPVDVSKAKDEMQDGGQTTTISPNTSLEAVPLPPKVRPLTPLPSSRPLPEPENIPLN